MTTISLPSTVDALRKHVPTFKAWLVENGSEILVPTNPYEVIRFKTDLGVGVIYCKGTGRLSSWVNGAEEAFRAFAEKKPWRAVPRTKRTSGKRKNRYETLVDRDGDTCLYCGKPMTAAEATIEHIVSATHGGPNHLANFALAHQHCNNEAAHLSAREKFELALRKRSASAADPNRSALPIELANLGKETP